MPYSSSYVIPVMLYGCMQTCTSHALQLQTCMLYQSCPIDVCRHVVPVMPYRCMWTCMLYQSCPMAVCRHVVPVMSYTCRCMQTCMLYQSCPIDVCRHVVPAMPYRRMQTCMLYQSCPIDVCRHVLYQSCPIDVCRHVCCTSHALQMYVDMYVVPVFPSHKFLFSFTLQQFFIIWRQVIILRQVTTRPRINLSTRSQVTHIVITFVSKSQIYLFIIYCNIFRMGGPITI